MKVLHNMCNKNWLGILASKKQRNILNEQQKSKWLVYQSCRCRNPIYSIVWCMQSFVSSIPQYFQEEVRTSL